MSRLILLFSVLFLSAASLATKYEYNLKFHRAQAWAEFYVIELNSGILKVGIDGHLDGTSYSLPVPDQSCEIVQMHYRPVVPMGQAYFNYEFQCDGGKTGVNLVKVEKVGSSVKQLQQLNYGNSRIGAGVWIDDQVVVTARGTIAVLDKDSGETIYIDKNLESQYGAVWFSRMQAVDQGVVFEYDTGKMRSPRGYLCLALPEGQLAPCK